MVIDPHMLICRYGILTVENIGDEDLITMFWINEHYNEDSPIPI